MSGGWRLRRFAILCGLTNCTQRGTRSYYFPNPPDAMTGDHFDRSAAAYAHALV
jgi:hypothetical protein